MTHCRKDEHELHDPALTALLRDTYADVPELHDAPERTDRIMRLVSQHAQRATHDLADPELTTLLRHAYADDPALAASPGRSERIMRQVLANGGRRVNVRWDIAGWLTGTAATAAAVVLFAMTLWHPVRTRKMTMHPLPVDQQAIAQLMSPPTDMPEIRAPQETRVPTTLIARQPEERSNPNKAPYAPTPRKNPALAKNIPEAPSDHEQRIADARKLYSTGSIAHAVGDYESAYEAYQASYDALPTPEALLASGQALEEMIATQGI